MNLFKKSSTWALIAGLAIGNLQATENNGDTFTINSTEIRTENVLWGTLCTITSALTLYAACTAPTEYSPAEKFFGIILSSLAMTLGIDQFHKSFKQQKETIS